MAGILTSQKSMGKTFPKRKFIHVDMTPMVDLGFLLISFFMFTTTFSKPNVMDLGLAAKGSKDGSVIDYRNQLTFVLGKDNRVFYYQKELADLTRSDIKETSQESIQIAKLLNSYKKMAPRPEIFSIIVKPTEESNYKNFVDMLDNMAVSKNERYGISEMQPKEKQLYEEIIK